MCVRMRVLGCLSAGFPTLHNFWCRNPAATAWYSDAAFVCASLLLFPVHALWSGHMCFFILFYL